jgi:hypothetical protein
LEKYLHIATAFPVFVILFFGALIDFKPSAFLPIERLTILTFREELRKPQQ